MPCPFSESPTFCWKKLGLRQLALEQFLRSAVIRWSSFSELPGAQLDYRSQSNWRFPRRRAVISNDSAGLFTSFQKPHDKQLFSKPILNRMNGALHILSHTFRILFGCPLESSRCPQEAWNNFTGFISCRNFQSKLPSRRLP